MGLARSCDWRSRRDAFGSGLLQCYIANERAEGHFGVSTNGFWIGSMRNEEEHVITDEEVGQREQMKREVEVS